MNYAPKELMIMRYMYDHGGITSREASFYCRSENLPARIYDLRRKGIPIIKEHIPPRRKGDDWFYRFHIEPEWRAANDRP